MKPDEMKQDFPFITRLSQSVSHEIGLCLIDSGEAAISFGDETSGKIACQSGQPTLLFHTHPFGTARISEGDIEGLLKAEETIKNLEYCVGAIKDDEPVINCVTVEVVKEQNRSVLSLSGK